MMALFLTIDAPGPLGAERLLRCNGFSRLESYKEAQRSMELSPVRLFEDEVRKRPVH